jgi:hypothetical protein
MVFSVNTLLLFPWYVVNGGMPTESPKVIFVADNELLERLDDYQFGNRIRNRSEAIRRLLDEALRRHEKKDYKKYPPKVTPFI